MKFKFNLFLIITLFILNSCNSLKEANKILKNEKIKTTDEFLVEKRDPLVFPPNYEQMPEPGTKGVTEKKEDERIKKILNATTQNPIATSETSTIEDSIIDKIRK